MFVDLGFVSAMFDGNRMGYFGPPKKTSRKNRLKPRQIDTSGCKTRDFLRKVVVGTGFEPVKAKPADLQSAPVDRLGILPPGRSGI